MEATKRRAIVGAILMLQLAVAVAAELSPERKKKVFADSYPSCLNGAAISAPNLSVSTREAYCRCNSTKLADLTDTEDIVYFNKYRRPSPHGQWVLETAARTCADLYVK